MRGESKVNFLFFIIADVIKMIASSPCIDIDNVMLCRKFVVRSVAFFIAYWFWHMNFHCYDVTKKNGYSFHRLLHVFTSTKSHLYHLTLCVVCLRTTKWKHDKITQFSRKKETKAIEASWFHLFSFNRLWMEPTSSILFSRSSVTITHSPKCYECRDKGRPSEWCCLLLF